ncbi:MAG: hypothetical protein U0838_03140 [Chloroflexota bacterium]
MHRRSLGPARRLALVAGILLVVGSVLPWYQVGGAEGTLPATVYRAFDGSGILCFLAGLATLALLALPYAMGERPTPLDRGVSFAVLAVLAILGIVLWVPNILVNVAGLIPTQAYGFWITVVGAVLLARAAFEIYLSPERR